MTILNKIKWVASILLVFFIVLVTNLIDKANFNRLRYSVTTIYEDRIIASDLLFELSMLMREKEVAYTAADTAFIRSNSETARHSIESLVDRYGQTKLTGKEQTLFSKLKEELFQLKRLEEVYMNSGFKDSQPLIKSIHEIALYLRDLSKVQLYESRQQMKISNKAMESIDLFTQVEIISLVVMAILIQVIILYKSKQN